MGVLVGSLGLQMPGRGLTACMQCLVETPEDRLVDGAIILLFLVLTCLFCGVKALCMLCLLWGPIVSL